jgi:hypothetical protein
MSSEDKNNVYINQVATSLLGGNNYTTIAVAGAAIFGSALYYYYNNSNNTPKNLIIDLNNQTREIEVLK